MKCKFHPSYNGQKKPDDHKCFPCWSMWASVHGVHRLIDPRSERGQTSWDILPHIKLRAFPEGTPFLWDNGGRHIYCRLCGNLDTDINWKAQRMDNYNIFSLTKHPRSRFKLLLVRALDDYPELCRICGRKLSIPEEHKAGFCTVCKVTFDEPEWQHKSAFVA